MSIPSASILLNRPILLIYATLEVLFALIYHLYYVPRANAIRPTVEEYRGYGRDRHRLMVRIMDRIERNCRRSGRPALPAMNGFLWDWFCRCSEGESDRRTDGDGDSRGEDGGGACEGDSAADCSMMESTSVSSLSAAAEEEATAAADRPCSTTPLQLPRRGDMDTFFAWAFFGKPHPDLLPWERTELQKMYSILDRRGLRFPPGRTTGVKPMRLTLDDVNATYRPLLVYGIFAALSIFGRLWLWTSGFRRHRSRSGLTYWHRNGSFPPRLGVPGPGHAAGANFPDATRTEDRRFPLLFFHGIAPGGLALYLPMVLWGFGRDGRPMMLFENGPISFSQCFEAVNEEECVSGVLEAMDRHLGPDATSTGVAVLGHSFGSCQLTWLLRSPEVRKAIRQVVLMDPVSILLSEPDVMTNFLYSRRESLVSMFRAIRPILLFPVFYLLDLLRPPSGLAAAAAQQTTSSSSLSFFRSSSSALTKAPPIEKGRYNKIWMVQSELFIEHYLRRNFAWYNSELWMEDIPRHVRVVVCVSGNDEILNPRKVRGEVLSQRDALVSRNSASNLELIYWPDAGHAYCVPRPWTWKQIWTAMERQEATILKEATLEPRS